MNGCYMLKFYFENDSCDGAEDMLGTCKKMIFCCKLSANYMPTVHMFL